MKITKTALTTILLSMGFLNLFSQCKNSDVPVCGGRTETRKVCAPIKSTELRSLSTRFYISPNAYNGMFDGEYNIKLQQAENGCYQLTCNKETAEINADEARGFLDIIKRYKLESNNGLTSVTAGLPSEFQPMYFTAKYASGETLSFTVNNNPQSEWQTSMFRYVRSLLLAHGNTAYAITGDTLKFTRLILEYSNGDGVVHKYGNIEYEDGTKLFRTVYDRKSNKDVADDLAAIPANHYEGLNALVDSVGLQWMLNNFSPNKKPDPCTQRYIYIYANDEDFNPLFSATYIDKRITDDIQSAVDIIREYMDKPFDGKK